MCALTRHQAHTGTWYWGVSFSRAGKRYERRLYEPKHGREEGAKAAAVAWRDNMLAKVKPMTKIEFCQIPRSNASGAIVGVVRLTFARPDGHRACCPCRVALH